MQKGVSYTEDGIIIFQPVAEKFLENPSKLINYQSKSSKTVYHGQRKTISPEIQCRIKVGTYYRISELKYIY